MARRRLLGSLLALVVVAIAAGGAAFLYRLASSYEVLEKGQILPYTLGLVYKIRFGGWLTIYVEPELRPNLDLLNAYLLTGIAFISLTFGVILATVAKETKSPRFWFFVASFFGMSALVADEILGIHETIGHNLQFLMELPLIKRPDDAVVLFLAVPALAVLVLFRSVILSSRRATMLFALALGGFVLSAVADILTLPLEEPLEVLTTICIAAAMIVLGLHHTGPSLRQTGSTKD